MLIVEDDDALAALLIEYLSLHGLKVSRVASGDAGVTAIIERRPDLVILDLMLPGANGLDVCRRVRGRFAGAIMMLTASQSEADHVAGLELGADDFVVKPVEPRILLARIRTQLRRLSGTRGAPRRDEDGVIRVGPLTVDVLARGVRVGDESVALTTMEFDVLRTLADSAGAVVTRDRLYSTVMGIEYDGLDRGMDVHVSRIRRKLGRAGFDIGRLKSIRGAGYLLAFR